VPLDFNIAKYFADQGLHWDTVQSLLGWPAGKRRHALRRFVEGTGRLSRAEINDLLRYVHDHCPNWLDYLYSPNVLQLMGETGRVRMYIVGGTQSDESRDHSSMFDLLALAYVNAHLPRTTWRPLTCEIEPCRIGWVRRSDGPREVPSIDAPGAPEWKVSFGSSKTSLPTTLLLERMYGREPAKPPAPEPLVFRVRVTPGRQLMPSRFIEEVSEDHQQGVSIRGGRPFLYVPPARGGPRQVGTDIGVVVCQADPTGTGGQMVVAGVSGPGTYAAAMAVVQKAELFSPRRATHAAHGTEAAGFDPEPIVGIVEATVEQESDGGGRVITQARLIYCSTRPEITSDNPVPLTVPKTI